MGNMIKSILATLAMVFAAGSALAGSLDAPAAPTDPGSAMYTGEDIYNRLTTGTAGVKRSGPFAEPEAVPTAGGHTLDEIMAAAPAADNTNGAAITDVLSGKTFWGLRTDGTWGLKTGSVAAGSNVTGGNGQLAITIPNALYSGGKSATAADSNLVAGNIKSGAAIFGVSGSVIQATGNAVAGNVLSGATFSNAGAAGLTGAMPDNGAVTITPGTTSKAIPAGYHNGSGTVGGDANLVTGNIKSGATIFGVSGAPAVVDTSSGTAAAGDLARGKAAYVNGALVTGTFVPALANRVNKTGQVSCWDSAGTLLSSCTGTGQDGEYQYGISPAMDPNGTAGPYNTPALSQGTRFTDNGDGTVTDNLTALIWLKNANCTDTVGGIAGGSLTWANALFWSSNLASGACGLSDNSKARDWRLPNINELHSLGPTFPPGTPFTGVQSSLYWSSTTRAGISTYSAWYVNMTDGYVNGYGKTHYGYYVWPVCGGQ